MTTVFIDGSAGTTGLRIRERLAARQGIRLLTLSEEERKSDARRSECINDADIVFLCLPDDAARQAVSFIRKDSVKVIDSSTAHRTQNGWAYGFAELAPSFREKIISSHRTAVPGCHASGFCSLVYPLVAGGVVSADYPFTAFSVTGYSGGGKKMIASYEDPNRPATFSSPGQYALSQQHKHLPEMQVVCGLSEKPIFSPIVGDFYSGMTVTVPLYANRMKQYASPKALREFFAGWYRDSALIQVLPLCEKGTPDGFAYTNPLAGKDNMEIIITGNEERILLLSRFCNLGKGASGAAVQCFNLMTGCEETTGLSL